MAINKIILSLVLLGALAGCGVGDDLFPSGADKRPAVQLDSTGRAVGQQAPGFTVSDSLGNTVAFPASLAGYRAVVLYFTMWCPLCDTHMSHIRDAVIPANPDVLFYAVDYVSGSVSASRNAEVSNGWDGSGFVVLADAAQVIRNSYDGTMGTVVVVDSQGVVRMNEDFKDGAKLQTVLGGLP